MSLREIADSVAGDDLARTIATISLSRRLEGVRQECGGAYPCGSIFLGAGGAALVSLLLGFVLFCGLRMVGRSRFVSVEGLAQKLAPLRWVGGRPVGDPSAKQQSMSFVVASQGGGSQVLGFPNAEGRLGYLEIEPAPDSGRAGPVTLRGKRLLHRDDELSGPAGWEIG